MLPVICFLFSSNEDVCSGDQVIICKNSLIFLPCCLPVTVFLLNCSVLIFFFNFSEVAEKQIIKAMHCL